PPGITWLVEGGNAPRFVKSPEYTPPMLAFGAPANPQPCGSRIVDVPASSSRVGALAGHSRPNAQLIDMPSGLLAPVKFAVFAFGFCMLFKNAALFALNTCTRPPSVLA